MDTAEIVRLVVEFLLAGGGLLAILRFVRDKRKDRVAVDTTALENAGTATTVIKDILAEVKEELDEERARNKVLRDELDAERRTNSSLRHDVASLTQQLAEAVTMAEVNRAQFARVQEELHRIRALYNIGDE